MKHHIREINDLLMKDKVQQAKDYLQQMSDEIISAQNIYNTGNEAFDGILNFYAEKYMNKGLELVVSVVIPENLKINIYDVNIILGNLLDNALENAINSCIKQCDNAVSKDNKRLITIKLFEKNNKICINIANTYFKEPRFHNQIPVTDEPDHGIGVRSIISVIEKYNGIYAFFTKDGTFYFQACI